METDQMSISWWINTQTGISLNGIVFNNKREQNTNTCYDMNVPQKHHGKSKKPDKMTTDYMIPFIWNSRTAKSRETENRLVLACGWSGNQNHKILLIYSKSLNCTLKGETFIVYKLNLNEVSKKNFITYLQLVHCFGRNTTTLKLFTTKYIT